jgi:hypothetical protein
VRAAHQTKGPSGQPPPAPLAGRVLWVGNLPFKVRAGQMVDAFAAAAGVDARSVRCSLYLRCISATSPPHLRCISATSPLHLRCISQVRCSVATDHRGRSRGFGTALALALA